MFFISLRKICLAAKKYRLLAVIHIFSCNFIIRYYLSQVKGKNIFGLLSAIKKLPVRRVANIINHKYCFSKQNLPGNNGGTATNAGSFDLRNSFHIDTTYYTQGKILVNPSFFTPQSPPAESSAAFGSFYTEIRRYCRGYYCAHKPN